VGRILAPEHVPKGETGGYRSDGRGFFTVLPERSISISISNIAILYWTTAASPARQHKRETARTLDPEARAEYNAAYRGFA